MTDAQTYREIDPLSAEGSQRTILSLDWLGKTNGLLPGWWSPARDVRLRQYWKESGHLASAVNTVVTKIISVPYEIRPRNKNNRASVARAQEIAQNLETFSQKLNGLKAALQLFLQDFFTQDNGGFMVLLAPPNRQTGDFTAPISPGDMVYGVRHLDAQRCTRTGDFEFPVVYRPLGGKLANKPIALHMSRVMHLASMPSTDEKRNGVGFCAVSRAFDAAQAILDMVTYRREKMGSMPARQLIFGSGMSTDDITKSMAQARQLMAASGNTMFAKTAMFGNTSEKAMLHLLDLTRAGDGFDEKVSMTLAVYALAWAFDVDSRTFWTATETGATKADAQVQHLKSYGQGIALALNAIKNLLDSYVLPPDVEYVFDYIDDEQDRMQAEVRNIRSQQRTADLSNGVYDIRTARARALDGGDLSKSEFEALELADGRLADGLPVLSLFESDEAAIQALLDLGADDPTNVAANEAAVILAATHLRKRECLAIALSSTRDKPRQQALQCYAALEALEKLYKEPVTPPPPPNEPPLPPDNPDEEVQKSLNDYRRSLRALARGYYNQEFDRFSFVDQMVQAISRNFTQAWQRAIKDCGLKPEDMTPEEQAILDQKINGQYQYILGLADALDEAREAGDAVTTLFDRIEMWVERYNEIQSLAKITSCGDKKYKWVRDPIKDSCPDCIKLDGRVYRGSIWAKYNIYPKAAELACGGWKCGCRFEETDEPVTKGKPPKLSGKKEVTECNCDHHEIELLEEV